MKEFDEGHVIKTLNKKADCRVHPGNGAIYVRQGREAVKDLGNGSWGKIDFLVNFKKYRILYVTSFR